MAAKIKFRVEAWAGDLYVGKEHFPVGEHEVSAEGPLARAIASAEAAGGVKVLSGTPPRTHIESDKDSLKVQQKAMSERDDQGRIVGPWQVGNIEDFIAQKKGLVREFKASLKRGVPDEADAESMETTINLAERQITEAGQRLAELKGD